MQKNGKKLKVAGKCKLPFRIGNIDVSHPVLITKGVTQECLLGADFLNKHNCVIDLPNGTLYSCGNIAPLIVQKGTPVSFLETTTIHKQPRHLPFHQREEVQRLDPPRYVFRSTFKDWKKSYHGCTKQD